MSDGEGAYKKLARTGEILTVEIFRDEDFLIKFTIPWSTRVQGKFLTRPNDPTDESRGDTSPLGSSKNPRASIFDPWMGFDDKNPGVWKREKLFMCVPGLDNPLNRNVRKLPKWRLEERLCVLPFVHRRILFTPLYVLLSSSSLLKMIDISTSLELITYFLLFNLHELITAPCGVLGVHSTSSFIGCVSHIYHGSIHLGRSIDDVTTAYVTYVR